MIAVHKKNLRDLYNQIKHSANKRGIEFKLKPTDLENLTFPITCPVLGIPLMFNSGKCGGNSYSIDRIDSSLGYCPNNIVVISNRANKLKSDATLDELKLLFEYYNELNEINLL